MSAIGVLSFAQFPPPPKKEQWLLSLEHRYIDSPDINDWTYRIGIKLAERHFCLNDLRGKQNGDSERDCEFKGSSRGLKTVVQKIYAAG